MLEMEIVEPEILEMEIEGQMPSKIGGTTNYEELKNKPQINGVELQGNKTLDELNIAPKDETNNKIEEVESIAKGANQALSFGDYSTMINVLNVLNNDTYIVGQNILVVTLNVPDLWVSNIAEESIAYNYTTDEDFTNQLKENGFVQVGYYQLSALETQKVDLTDYIKNTDYATSSKGGAVKIDSSYGISVNGDGTISTNPASESDIDAKENAYKPITPKTMDYAVKKGLTDNQTEWTEEEKQSAKDLLGIVAGGATDFFEPEEGITYTTTMLREAGLEYYKWYFVKTRKIRIYPYVDLPIGAMFKLDAHGAISYIYTTGSSNDPSNWHIGSQYGARRGYRAILSYPSIASNNDMASYVLTSYQGEYSGSNTALGIKNTASYTPTANYHPSTKKYVDDSIATALGDIETLLGGI